MPSDWSPAPDRRAAASVVLALLDDPVALRGLIDRADADAGYRFEVLAGLALALVDVLVKANGVDGTRELLHAVLWDVEVDGDD